ncbi:MAG: cadmium-translocating P-type ATPase [Pedobacter sp.]|nr:cadmium-translocating P-type ATPase [Pedobacter sp.]
MKDSISHTPTIHEHQYELKHDQKDKDREDDNDHEDEHDHDNENEHAHDHGHEHGGGGGWRTQAPLLVALFILVVMQILELGFQLRLNNYVSLFIYGAAFLLSGYKVLDLAYRKAIRFDFFNEFVLMSVATIGAFAIGAYSEGLAVMVFYSVGEWFQDAAVDKAKRNIKSLLDLRPDLVEVIRHGKVSSQKAETVDLGETIQVKAGELVPLDGILQSEQAAFNTAALTGESMPETKLKGAQVFAGMISINQPALLKVNASYKDSKLSKILELVQDATARKSKTQLFISKFAKVYTPIVFALALLVVCAPYLIVQDYSFREWLYRGLVFLVVSCPCALVVSIPLGYFGGIGLASKNGILFKGSNFLDVMAQVDTVVLDKTGTLTKGVFEVQKVVSLHIPETQFIKLLAALESKSTHPIATAIAKYSNDEHSPLMVTGLEEISGYGLKGSIDGKRVIAGNLKLLKNCRVTYDASLENIQDTIVAVAIDDHFAGYVVIADSIKDDAKAAVIALKKKKVHVVMLSGDKRSVVERVAALLGIDEYYGDLLPEDKVKKLEELKAQGRRVAFAGDGINDAPVIAASDAGIAMGALGSGATIETADVVIQNDQPSKISVAIRIGQLTKNIVWQNISLALAVKIIVLILGAGGLATLWEAVIADVGVALLAIFNAIRIQRMQI